MKKLETGWKQIKVITDMFSQCDKCSKWVRLYPEDELRMRTIPLFNIISNDKKIWVCEQCFDKHQEEKYGDE